MSDSLLMPTTAYLPLITEDVGSHHANLVNAYKPRFPGLEEVVYDPVKFARVCEIIGVELEEVRMKRGGGGGREEGRAGSEE